LEDNNDLEREPWVDFVRVTAIFLVVLLHSAAPWLYRYGQIDDFDWQIGNIIDSASRVSVPLFFMITGYLLINKPMPLKRYFNKRIKRIVIPWLGWSCIYLIYKNSRIDAPITLIDGFLQFVNGEIYFHFWFLYVLVGLYLFVPIISWFIEFDTLKRSSYFLILWVLTASIIPFLNEVTAYTTSYDLKTAVDLSMFAGFSGYLIAGTLLGKDKASIPSLALFSGAYALGIVLTVIGTSLGTYKLGRYIGYFYEYTAPNVVIASVAAFAILKKVGQTIIQSKRLSGVFARIGYATLGIYLIHPIFINALNDGFLGPGLASLIRKSSLTIPLVAVITFVLSYTAVEIILHIPVVRKIV